MFGWLRGIAGAGDTPSTNATPVLTQFYSSIAGDSHDNDDGTSRQAIIRDGVRAGDVLTLRFEDSNRFDHNAVAVFTAQRRQIGYLHAELAPEVRGRTADGQRVTVTVANVTGGTADKPTLGVNILVMVAAP